MATLHPEHCTKLAHHCVPSMRSGGLVLHSSGQSASVHARRGVVQLRPEDQNRTEQPTGLGKHQNREVLLRVKVELRKGQRQQTRSGTKFSAHRKRALLETAVKGLNNLTLCLRLKQVSKKTPPVGAGVRGGGRIIWFPCRPFNIKHKRRFILLTKKSPACATASSVSSPLACNSLTKSLQLSPHRASSQCGVGTPSAHCSSNTLSFQVQMFLRLLAKIRNLAAAAPQKAKG